MKIITVVGARPQFIKAAVGSRELRKRHTEILVHTGQHYDPKMSDVFFQEMGIPQPDYNLGITGGSHAQMTARMLVALEEVFVRERPDALLVYGDTNSTLASALCAVKLHLPVAHMEAGNRFGSLDSPEEVNRILTDHVSTLRFACVQSAWESLQAEHLQQGSFLVGDPMYDAFLYYANQSHKTPPAAAEDLEGRAVPIPQRFYYMTCHRQENTENPQTLQNILDAMEELDAPVLYPVHPRNEGRARELHKARRYQNIRFLQPVGYLTSLYLVRHAQAVVTDSGGVQREAFFAGRPCVTVLDFVVWPETMVGNRNQLSKPEKDDILAKLAARQTVDPLYQPFGDGHAARRMVCRLEDWDAQRQGAKSRP